MTHAVNTLRPELPELPRYIQRLPVDRRGYPVPWFVAWIDGEPEFRVTKPNAATEAWTRDLCWVCGGKLGRFRVFAIGPMCAVNRVSAEPPSHLDCATFSVKGCPFLVRPHMRRRENDLPPGVVEPGGHMIRRNPGVMLLWVTTKPKIKRVDEGLFRFDPIPESVSWWAHGRKATRQEVLESITSGLPLLREAAETRPGDVRKLEREVDRALALVPA